MSLSAARLSTLDPLGEDFRGRYLEAGSRVAVIAPASPFDTNDFERGIERLRGRYDVQFDPGILARKGYLAGDDTRRLRELQAAIDDPNIDGILAARGGYGVTRLLPKLKLSALGTRPKLLVGFSDITALHALWARHRCLSIHGTMIAALGRSEPHLVERFVRALEGTFVERHTGLTTAVPGETEGILQGGNLTVLTALLATPHAPLVEGAVLFFEDIGERPYRIDRMLTTWRDAGAFAAVRGIVLGAFTQCDPGPDGVSTRDVLIERLSDLGIPVVLGFPAGHIDDNAELPFGRRVSLDATRGELQLLPRRNA
jgi:muramoyltetrapeptide carboxypeptidase